MNTSKIIFSISDIATISQTKGAVWDFFAGENLFPDMFTVFDVIVSCNRITLRVVCDLILDNTDEHFDARFAEEPNHSSLSISLDVSGLPIAEQGGNIYYFNKGETVQDVLIIRDVVTSTQFGESVWHIVEDSGLVFILETGCIAICKDGYHDELMSVRRANTPENLNLPNAIAGKDDELGQVTTLERALIPISELLTKDLAGV
jgi:hypothetical protein